jgi:glucose-1-phosphate thymidylyltransferase
MRALIPVAGYGTRMRPHTLTHPKVLLPVADKPMIGHIVDKLIEDGVDELVFVVGHLGDEVEKYIRHTYRVTSHFIEQTEFLGLGHAIYSAGKFLTDSPIIIVLGDTIYDVNLKNVLKGTHSSLGVKQVENPRRFGVAVLDNDGFVTKLVEKPKEFVSNLALVGLYYFTRGDVLLNALKTLIDRNIRTKDEFQLTSAIQIMIENNEKINVFDVEGWYDCGKPETLFQTNSIILKRDFGDKKYEFENSVVIPPVYVHPDAGIKNTILGPNVTVNKNAAINGAIIKDSIIGEGAKIENIILKNSLIGDNVVLSGQFRMLNVGDYSEFNYE